MLDTYLWYEINTSSLFLRTHIKISCVLRDEPQPSTTSERSPCLLAQCSPCTLSTSLYCANPGQVSLRTAGAFSKGT